MTRVSWPATGTPSAMAGMAILSGIQSSYTMLVQGVVLVVAITFIIINIIVDMLYILIDPRIRTV